VRRAERLARAYGSDIELVLRTARSLADLGAHFGAGLYRAEVDYLVAREWARTSEDILRRRTKLVMRADSETVDRLDRYLAELRLAA
jgi:glycerol-3-phosphate dehydrogenase